MIGITLSLILWKWQIFILAIFLTIVTFIIFEKNQERKDKKEII